MDGNDVALFSAIAGVVGVVGGIISSLINSWLQSKAQSRMAEIQEVQTDTSVKTSQENSATALAASASQATIQLYSALQECISSKQLVIDKYQLHQLAIARHKVELELALSDLLQLIEDLKKKFSSQGIPCSGFDEVRIALIKIMDELEERSKLI